MPHPKVAPYGSWESPITSDLIVAETTRLGAPQFDGDNLIWLEGRPQDSGRLTVVQRAADGTRTDRTGDPYNVRTRVHEYGGGDYRVSRNVLTFTNFADQRIYRQAADDDPIALTVDVPNSLLRYADFEVDHERDCLYCVREDHRNSSDSDADEANTIVKISTDPTSEPEEGTILLSGNDFYSSPRLSPDGSQLAWLTWNHPNMPWDGTELWVGDLNRDGTLGSTALIAGGPNESITQPIWSPDGILTFLSDSTGWWNLYRWQQGAAVPLCPKDAEFGSPQWQFGMSSYAYASAKEIICVYGEDGQSHLARLDLQSSQLETITNRYTKISNLSVANGKALFIGYSSTEPSSIILFDLATKQPEILRSASTLDVGSGYIAQPQAFEFPTENGQIAHAYFYKPDNKDFSAPSNETPPLIVLSHGGPTAAASAALNMTIQYWTSRGIAVVDVDYGGSSGYGRAYRQRLNGQWGVVDVDDCVNAARYLAVQGLVDGNRLAIAGGSAGGYTTLCALAFRDVFKAGASHFGIADLETMTKHTHKFESRYIDNLVGPYPERIDLYHQRSPIYAVDQFSCPLILFQGLDDKVVPPEQSQMMFDAVRAKGIPVAYLPFEGEQHGFRQAKNIKRSLDAELYFYSTIFGFALADEVEAVEIENL